jgi:GDP-L-fucose synthase
VVERLRAQGCGEIMVPRSAECDLRDPAAAGKLLEQVRPDMVIHLAAVVGGIGANRRYPGRFFYENALMGLQLVEAARRQGVEKFVAVGTVCAYPKFTPLPFRESDLWNGYPDETNAAYGLAKKMLLAQLQAYRQEYGMNGIYLLPANLYGPHDNFDLESSHVIPALIRKFVEAQARSEQAVRAWGTGVVTREFLYVEDAAEGVVLAAERYNSPEPVNLGSGEEISVRELAEIIRDLCWFDGEIEWDASLPDGQPLRRLDTTRAEREFGFRARVPLRQGLTDTIRWYREHHGQRGRPQHA